MNNNNNDMKISFTALGHSTELKGEILNKWNELGGKCGLLGYPIEDEMAYRDAASSMKFQHGSIYSHPEHGTHFVKDKFYRYWADQLGVYGKYGYPTSDPYSAGENICQDFVGGVIRSDMHDIKDKSDLRGEIVRRGIDIRLQGKRGTCSVQTMVFLLEYQYSGLLGREYNHLSVEYANHMANVADGLCEDGHYFSSIAAGYKKYGIVKECLFPYNKDWEYNYEQAELLVNPDLVIIGKQLLSNGLELNGRFVKEIGDAGLSDAQFDEIISLLDSGIPVGVGRDHSLSLVGYERDLNQNGGGIMVFKNSYGTTPHFTGYQTETFAQVKATVFDAYVFEHAPGTER